MKTQIKISEGNKFFGFYFFSPKTDYFFITNKTKRTPQLVKTIENILNENNCTYRGLFGCREIKTMLNYSSIEKKQFNERFYYSINGDGFSYGEYEDIKQPIIYIID